MQLFKKIFDKIFYGGLEDWSFSLSISFIPFLHRGLFFASICVHLLTQKILRRIGGLERCCVSP